MITLPKSTALLLGLTLLLAGGLPAPASADPVFDVADDNPVMQQAYHDARQSLPAFLTHALHEGTSIESTLIKVSLDATRPGDPEAQEVIWVAPFQSQSKNRWSGTLVNEPDFLPGLHRGDEVTFKTAQIVDWAWIDADGVFYGSYTLRALLELGQVGAQDLPPLSRTPTPKGW